MAKVCHNKVYLTENILSLRCLNWVVQLGIHLMRNKQCQIGTYDEHSHCLVQRYHTLVDRTPTYIKKSEIYTNFVLNINETVSVTTGVCAPYESKVKGTWM